MTEKLYSNPDIYCIYVPLPDNPLKNLNCYVVMDGGECLIIDTGFNRPECRKALLEGLGELGVDLGRAKLFLSHCHADHTGLVGFFRDKRVPIYISRADWDITNHIVKSDRWWQAEQQFLDYGFPPEEMQRQKRENQGKAFAAHEAFEAMFTDDGDKITVGDTTLTAVSVPGHTPGQMCLYLEKEKLFFSADHVLFDITPNISIWCSYPNALEHYLQSLERVKKYDIVRTFPGHRGGAGDIYERIEALKKHHEKRLQEVVDIISRNDGCTGYFIASQMKWSSRGRLWEDFVPNMRWFAVGEALAHIEYLEGKGIICEDEDKRLHLA